MKQSIFKEVLLPFLLLYLVHLSPSRQPVLSFPPMVSFCKYNKIHTYLSYRKDSIQYITYYTPSTIYTTYVHLTPCFFHHTIYLDITPDQCVEISVISFSAAEGSLL